MLNILSNFQHANPYSFDVAAGAVSEGEWVKFNASGKLEKVAATPVAGELVMQVFGGSARYDSKELGRVTVLTGTSYYGETDKFEATAIVPGTPLTVSANGLLTKVTDPAAQQIVGYATYSSPKLIRFTRV